MPWARKLAIITWRVALASTKASLAQFTAGTVASYAAGCFTTGGVTYWFPTNDYAFSGMSVAPIPASAVYLAPDPRGANTGRVTPCVQGTCGAQE